MAGKPASTKEGAANFEALFPWQGRPLIGAPVGSSPFGGGAGRRLTRIQNFPAATSTRPGLSSLHHGPRRAGSFPARLVALSNARLGSSAPLPRQPYLLLSLSQQYQLNSYHSQRDRCKSFGIAPSLRASPAASRSARNLTEQRPPPSEDSICFNCIPLSEPVCHQLQALHPLKARNPVTQQNGRPVESLAKPNLRPIAAAST
jgi:hypothetical protein